MIYIKKNDIKASKKHILNHNNISSLLKFISNNELSKTINTIQELSNKNLLNEQKLKSLKEKISENKPILKDFAEKIIDEIVILAKHQNHYFGTNKIDWFGQINETKSILKLKNSLGILNNRDTFSFIGNSIFDKISKEKFYPLSDYIMQTDINREKLIQKILPNLKSSLVASSAFSWNEHIDVNSISIQPDSKKIQIQVSKENTRQKRFYSNELNLRVNQYIKTNYLENKITILNEISQIFWIKIINTCMDILCFQTDYFSYKLESYFEIIKKMIRNESFADEEDKKAFEAACKVFFAKKIDWSFFDTDLKHFLNLSQ